MSAVVGDETTGGSCTQSGGRHSGGITERVRASRREISDRGGSHWREEGGRCPSHVIVMWGKGRTDAGWVDGGR